MQKSGLQSGNDKLCLAIHSPENSLLVNFDCSLKKYLSVYLFKLSHFGLSRTYMAQGHDLLRNIHSVDGQQDTCRKIEADL